MKFVKLIKKGQVILVVGIEDDETKIKWAAKMINNKRMKYRKSNIKTCRQEAGLLAMSENRFVSSAIQQRNQSQLRTCRNKFKLRQYLLHMMHQLMVYRRFRIQEKQLPLEPYVNTSPVPVSTISSYVSQSTVHNVTQPGYVSLSPVPNVTQPGYVSPSAVHNVTQAGYASLSPVPNVTQPGYVSQSTVHNVTQAGCDNQPPVPNVTQAGYASRSTVHNVLQAGYVSHSTVQDVTQPGYVSPSAVHNVTQAGYASLSPVPNVTQPGYVSQSTVHNVTQAGCDNQPPVPNVTQAGYASRSTVHNVLQAGYVSHSTVQDVTQPGYVSQSTVQDVTHPGYVSHSTVQDVTQPGYDNQTPVPHMHHAAASTTNTRSSTFHCPSNPPRNDSENVISLQRPSPTPITTEISSPAITSSVNTQPPNRMPRHKRRSHIKAEVKRRHKIQDRFDELRKLVPAIADSVSRESKSTLLFKASERCQSLERDIQELHQETVALKEQIRVMTSQLEHVQNELPVGGVDVIDSSNHNLQRMFDNHIQTRARETWQFCIISFLITSLFDSFKTSVSTKCVPEFVESVKQWADDKLTLVNFRPLILSTLKQISTSTSILTEPEKFKEEISALVTKSNRELPS
ncbi:carbohydrate-responsive element-binding protein-like [Gigantopelta aegis]|uniref:carbohydrate-responsive element-binding protein-like n=1 Tax=Gigantopelta aegis TaxID=1735272 RepID=UPI001B887B16|nr:carbohydrate-responsive element-binding protein-like [Gigantopelta aegis]